MPLGSGDTDQACGPTERALAGWYAAFDFDPGEEPRWKCEDQEGAGERSEIRYVCAVERNSMTASSRMQRLAGVIALPEAAPLSARAVLTGGHR